MDWPHSWMVRIHGTSGPFALPWHRLRHFGPTRSRFDPHPIYKSAGAPAFHPDFAVTYAAADVDTALAEVFQRGRVIEPAGPNNPYLTVWRPVRPLELLDIRGAWPIRAGASHALNTGPQSVCRRWAHAIATHPRRVDGILYASSMTGRDAVALFLPGADSFPVTPELSMALSNPGLVQVISAAADRIGDVVHR